jgi:hypothetical protein
VCKRPLISHRLLNQCHTCHNRRVEPKHLQQQLQERAQQLRGCGSRLQQLLYRGQHGLCMQPQLRGCGSRHRRRQQLGLLLLLLLWGRRGWVGWR